MLSSNQCGERGSPGSRDGYREREKGMKRIHRMLVAMCATVLWVGVCAAAPWAMWTDFTGADAAEGLAPQASSTQNNIDGGAWRFKLAGDASVDDGGILSTGTTAAPRIDFGGNLNLGYNGNPFTVVMVVRNVGTATGKPLCCVGGTIGTALAAIDKTAGTATVKGMWKNVVWGGDANVARSVDTLAGTGVTVLATSYTSGGVVVKTVTASEVTTLGTWGGLKSGAFEAQRIFFGNTNDGTSGGLNFELLAVAIYRGEPEDAELTWFADDDAVYTWQGTSGTFHNGPWKTTPRYALAEDGGSSRTWKVFASNQTSYVAPGRILRFAAPEASGDGVFVGALDAQFAPFDLGGLVVEPGAKGYSFASSTGSARTLGLGDRSSSPRATAFVFHEDFTVNRVATGGQSDTTTFHGPVSVVIDEGKTFTISEEAEVASGATVTVTGGGTLAFGKTLAMAGALTIEDGTLSIPNLDLRKVPVTFGENGSLLVSGTLTLDGTTPIRLSALPQTIDLSALTSMPNASYDRLIFFADGVTPDWGNVTLSWGDLGEPPDFVTVTTDETGLSVTVNRTEDNFIVMPMGDSITEGSGNAEDAPSYRKALSEQMLAAGMVPRFVGARIYKSSPIADENCRYHTGLSGHRVQTASGRGGYLQGAPNWLEQAGYPDAVTLMIGTNDWINENQGTEAVTAGAATVFARWKALVKTMVAMRPNTWFIVSPITPPRSDRTDMTTYVGAYNAHIKSLFTTAESSLTVNGEPVNCVLGTLNEAGKAVFGENAKVMMASMYDALPAENNAAYFFDNLHPSQAGYDRMAAVWLEAIKTLQGKKGGLKDAEVVVDAYQTAGAMDAVTVVFNHEQKGTEDLSIQVGGVAATISEATLSEDGRRVTLKLSEPLTDGAEVTVGKAGQMRTFTAKATTAESRVGQEATEGYVKVKTLAVPLKGGWHTEEEAKAAFTVTDGAASVRAFDRLGYYVTLARPDGALRYLWVSMDAPVALLTMDALGLPTTSLRVKVSNLRVASNVPGIDNVTEDGVEGLLQFSPNNIKTDAADAAHPVSLGDIYDWNTAYGTTAYGYGAMQIFRLYKEGVGRVDSGMPASTLFSYSRWASESEGDDEITLGDLANHQGYSTGTQKASLTSIFTSAFPTLSTAAYSVRTIEIWVRPASTLTWAGATSGTWDKSDASVWKNVATPFVDGDTVAFGELSEGATEATVTVGETVAPLGLIVSKNAFTFAGETISTGALMVAEGASATFSGRLEADTATVNGALSIAQGSIGAAPTGAGKLVKTGTDALTLNVTSASNVLPAYHVKAGTLTLTKTNSNDGANFNGTPSFTVASGAHLVLDANDLVGWSHANTVTIAEVAGVLEKLRDSNETFSGRLLLKDGGVLRNSATDNLFLLHNSAIVEVEAGADASITGNAIRINNGTPEFLAGEGAHLSVSAPLTIPGSITLKKTGEGTVTLSSDVSGAGNGWGTLEVTEGTLNVGDVSFDATLRVGASATLELAGSLNKGGLPVTIEGTLAGHGVLSGANGNATIAVTSTAKLMAPAKGETLTLSPGNAQSVSIAAGATVTVGEGTLCLANGYAKQGEGSICVALPEGVVLAKGEALPVLTVNAGMGPVVEDFSAPEGLSLYVEDGTLFVANLVAVDRPSGETETWSSAALRALSSAVGALPDGESVTRITSVEVATRGGTAVSTGVAEINAALACFSGIAMAEAGADGTATVRVAYDFGIDAMVVDADRRGVVVTLRVQGPEGEDGADFAEGVQFTFMDAEETPLEATPLEGASLSAGERLFHLSLPQEGEKFAFRVRVSKP